MNVMELGAIGELVGGVAVLVTLIYLAIQVGQNVKQLKVNGLQTAVTSYAERIEDILCDDERRGVFLEGLKGLANLSHDDRLKFHGMLTGSISIFENNLNLYRSGVLPLEQITVYERDVVGLLKSPGASIWWDQIKNHYFSTSMKEHLDGLQPSHGPHPTRKHRRVHRRRRGTGDVGLPSDANAAR